MMPDDTRPSVPPSDDGWNRRVSRRDALKRFGGGLAALSALGTIDALAWTPTRVAQAAAGYPDIQFDIGAFMPPAITVDGVLMSIPPVYTVFTTASLTRTPTATDQRVLDAALKTVEAAYPFSPRGVFTHIAYGLPYFNRLSPALVAEYMPIFTATGAAALQEAVPGPSDVSTLNPSVTKQTFNVPVAIESNDLLLTLRSDSYAVITDVLAWLIGSDRLAGHRTPSPAFRGLFTVTSTRVAFAQVGLPRKIADQARLPYANRVNPASPMWMGFFSQQSNGFAPAAIATFQGNASAQFTGMPQADGTTRPVTSGDYFYDGSIQVLAHDILDLAQWYADGQTYSERVQLMFRSNPSPATGNADQYTNGGGPAALPNAVVLNASDGTSDAQNAAMANGRVGHLQALQRTTRAPDGSIVPQRIDAPGFDAMDMPGGALQPKLQFSAFVPAAQNFTRARQQAGAPDLSPSPVPPSKNGIEAFITATRRQNFLCPPRAHRAFPLLELAR